MIGMLRKRRDTENEIRRIISYFPQVERLYGISRRKMFGNWDINISLSFNTFIVRGNGACTCSCIENALKKRFGESTKVSFSIVKS